MRARPDLAGLTITGNAGHIAIISGVPDEGTELLVQWTYRESLMLTALPSGLMRAGVEAELGSRMEKIDELQDVADLVGEVL